MNTAAYFRGRALLTLILTLTAIAVAATDQQNAWRRTGDNAGWRTFTNRAGWEIKCPRNWRAQSCRQCDDLTAPNAPLALSDPSNKEGLMIERLADKPKDEAIEKWLPQIAKGDTPLLHVRREEWTALTGSKALKVIDESGETIYVTHGSLTIAIRYDPTQAVKQVISTLKFHHRK